MKPLWESELSLEEVFAKLLYYLYGICVQPPVKPQWESKLSLEEEFTKLLYYPCILSVFSPL